jgi:hypothetical protein
MSSLKVMELPNINSMRKALSKCHGKVFLQLPNEKNYLLDKDSVLMNVFSMFEHQKVALNLLFEDSSDTAALLGMFF